MKRIFCAVGIALVAWQAWAGEPEDGLKKLEAALQQASEAKTAPATPPPANFLQPQFPIAALRQQIEQKDYENALQMLQQIAVLPEPEAVRKAANDLVAALRKEVDARKKAAVAQVEAVLKRATETVKNAKTPADLDAVVGELGSLKNQQDGRCYRSSSEIEDAQRLRRQVEGTYRFATTWQEYLAAQASGDANRTRNTLENLLRLDVFLIPRSELLARLQQPAAAGPKGDASLEATAAAFAAREIAKAHGPDDMEALLKTLRTANDTNRNNRPPGWGDLNRYVQELSEMEHCYREFKTGFPVNTNLFRSIGQAPTALLPLKNQLYLLVLPRFIQAPEGLTPKKDETVSAYLARVQEEAKARGDVELVLRALRAQRRIQQHEYRTSRETQAVNQTQAAKAQETAGNYALAVIAYQNALATGDELTPVKWILKRLDEIKKDHPQAYKEGMSRILAQAGGGAAPAVCAEKPAAKTAPTPAAAKTVPAK